jgi:hypothetical protein
LELPLFPSAHKPPKQKLELVCIFQHLAFISAAEVVVIGTGTARGIVTVIAENGRAVSTDVTATPTGAMATAIVVATDTGKT